MGSVYKQPETEVDDSYHSWRVPSKWKGCKGKLARGARGVKQGEQREAPCIDWIKLVSVCMLNDCSGKKIPVVHNNNSQNECCHVYNNNRNERCC